MSLWMHKKLQTCSFYCAIIPGNYLKARSQRKGGEAKQVEAPFEDRPTPIFAPLPNINNQDCRVYGRKNRASVKRDYFTI